MLFRSNSPFTGRFVSSGFHVCKFVEMSTNLQTWKPLLTNLPVNGLFDYIDLNATNGQRFYRVRQ